MHRRLKNGSIITREKNAPSEKLDATELYSGRVDPWIGSSRVRKFTNIGGSGRVGSGQVRSGQVRSGRVRSGRVRSGQVGPMQF